jgi:hypothetical protein
MKKKWKEVVRNDENNGRKTSRTKNNKRESEKNKRKVIGII